MEDRIKQRCMRVFLIALLGVFSSFTLNAQNGSTIKVKGTVNDVHGVPVIGASVMVQGSTVGTITDLDGIFTIDAPSAGTLEIKYIGYKVKLVPVQNRTSMVVTLEEDAKVLEQVVVIGYGTVKKNDVTGSVTAIKPDEMNKGLTVNAQDMIVGKIAGVNVTLRDGTPGGSSRIRIRGGSSLSASNDPLIVIDGLPMDNDGIKGVTNALSTINPDDIETFTVLKDASATAIYGSRASNGVIIINTKRGVAGAKPKITYSGSVSIGILPNKLDVMDGDQYRAYINKLFADKPEIIAKVGTQNTNWQKEIYQTAITNDHNLSIVGGGKNLPYRFSFGYTNENGILKTANMERYTTAIMMNPSFFDDHLKVNLNAKMMLVNNRFAHKDAVGNAITMDPTRPVRSNDPVFVNEFGGFFQWYNTEMKDGVETISYNALSSRNPVSLLELNNDRARANDFNGGADIDYKFHGLPELRAHLFLGLNVSDGRQTELRPFSHPDAHPYNSRYFQTQLKKNSTLTYYMQYSKEIDKHSFDLMGGYEWQYFQRNGNESWTYTTNRDVQPKDPRFKPFATHSRLNSYFGRFNYSFADRYLFTATVRHDGSSRFAPEHRWSTFPAFALAWKINEEGFMKNQQLFSDLKLRLGYGITGQQNITDNDFPFLPVYQESKAGASYPIGDDYHQTSSPKAYNRDLKWEETTTYNAGFDVGMWSNRLTATVDYYFRKTDNLINFIDIPIGTNFSNRVLSNIGSLENQGIEFALNYRIISNRDLTWEVNYNVAHNRNKITKLTTSGSDVVEVEGISSGTGNNIQGHSTGFPSFSFYSYQQVYDNNGKPIEGLFVDRNGDGIINEQDRYFNRTRDPKVLMGLASKVIYKKFDFGFSLRASIGNYIYNDVAARTAKVGRNGLVSTSNGVFSNRPMAAFETNFTGEQDNYFMSDYFVQNASFLRFDNITLGYSFSNLFNTIQGGRIFFTAQNPFIITKYSGLDPEKDNGVDRELIPRPFVSILGLSLNF